jgi:hypothetical protein
MKNKLLLLLLILVSCTGLKKDKLSDNKRISESFFQINIERVEARQEVKYLSDLASKVEYVQLETNKDCIINRAAKFLFTDSLILVDNSFHVLKYSRNGKFLGQISTYGRGPGENLGIGSLSVIPKRNILAIQTYRKILLYSTEGELIESIRTPIFTSTLFIADDRIIAYYEGGMGNELFTFLLTNRKIDTIAFVKNPFKWRDDVPNSTMTEYPYFDPFFQDSNRFYVKSIYNDTLYKISENKIMPDYFIDLGKYKLPPEWNIERVILQEPEKMQQLFKIEEQCYYCNVFESANKIFLTLVNFKTHKPKYFFFEKSSAGNGYMLRTLDKEPASFINDWDGGMDFWPEGKIDDKHLFMSLKVADLKKELDQTITDQKDTKLTNAQEKFKKMISDIDISANPILMILTLK